MFKAIERRVKRALWNLQTIPGNLLNAEQDPITMKRPKGHRLEDQNFKYALKQFDGLAQAFS